MVNRKRKGGSSDRFLFLGSKISVDGDCSPEIGRQLLIGRKAMTDLDSVLKSRDIALPTKVHIDKAMVFPVVTNGCESWNSKEGRAPKNWCLWTERLVKTPESRLDSKEIKPVDVTGDPPWIFIGRTDTEAPVFWSPDATDDSLEKPLFSIVAALSYIPTNSIGGFLFPHTEGTFLDDIQRSLSVSPFLPPSNFLPLSLSLFFPPPFFPPFFVQLLPSQYFAPWNSSFLNVPNLQVLFPQLSKTSRPCLGTTFCIMAWKHQLGWP